jgi:hypothetical protein
MNADAESGQKDMNLKDYIKIKLLISDKGFLTLHRLSAAGYIKRFIPARPVDKF